MVELAAPAGDARALDAAVQHGADAVYLGLPRFNARARADNFTAAQLGERTPALRARGVKVYVTLNTLAFDGELARIERAVREAVDAGADALIVQDLGVARLARAICPELSLHASTQTSLATADGLAELAALGIERVVLPRELDVAAIRALREVTELELEVFVHGALCVSWSGQCLASLARGGRSGNRGACAQPCRLPYEALVDGGPPRAGTPPYLLSPGDLWAVDALAELVAIGVDSFKIEGRLKRAEYVAASVHHYRLLLDRIARGEPATLDDDERRQLLQPFHRAPSPGYLDGGDHRRLVEGRTPGARGLRVGTVLEQRGRSLLLDGAALPLKAGDGVALREIDEGGGERVSAGGRVRAVEPLAGGRIRVRMGPEFAPGDGGAGRPRRRGWLERTDDPAATRRWRLGIEGRSRDATARRRDVVATLRGRRGGVWALELDAGDGGRAEVRGGPVAFAAPGDGPPALDEARARRQLARMGDTPLSLRELRWQVDAGATAAPRELNTLRREACARLEARLRAPRARTCAAEGVAGRWLAGIEPPADAPVPDGLYVLCRTVPQLVAARAAGPPAGWILDPADPADGDALLDAAGGGAELVVLALPRTVAPGEAWQPVAAPSVGGWLVRSLDQLPAARRRAARGGLALLGDPSLNVVNAPGCAQLWSSGLDSLAPGHDLDLDGTLQLARRVGGAGLDVVLHTRLPLFHTAHCLFAARVARAAGRPGCGEVCRRRALALRDRDGRRATVIADALCRNTVFDERPRDWSAHVGALLDAGVRRFRLELVDEDAATTGARVAALARRLADQRSTR